jgi:predicted amidohydrolase
VKVYEWWKAMLRRTFLAALGAASHAQSDVPRFTIAGLCVVPDRWEKEANLRKLDRYARQAAAQGAKVIVTPEGFLDGYVANDRDLDRNRYRSVAEPIQGSAIQRVRKLAAELKVFLAIGFSELRDELVFNTVAIFGPDGSLVSRYSKTHCGGEPHNTEGRDFPVVQTILGRWGTMICLDRQLPETARILAIKGAQMILNPSYGMYGEMNDVMMRTRAYENAVYVVFVHPKRCLVIDPKGKILSSNRGEGDQVVLAPIVLDERIGTGPIRSRRPEIYGEILKRN